ncbi:TIGR02808 family protein [Oceanicoccus sagamiensis]|uniref:TIGR02808 family protein n=1 Tax=Oceanicoccus sagamiensis TaxID=716816 RepID=A0A1X9N825_9GAMM|nr:TIGR02808 family protein [Oceanicoccus sagamiensis]
MSQLESIFWHVVGYSAMPFIILAGFAGVAVASVWVLSLTSDKADS